jgi:hypothetical protein
MTRPRQGIGTTLIVVAVVIVLIIATIAFLTLSSQTSTPPHGTQSQTTTTCPGESCLPTFSYIFTISINYTGSWNLIYQGYNSLGRSSPNNVSGGDTGSGFYSKSVTLSGLDSYGLTLCAAAQKLDGSGSTLILTLTGYNETSQPYGSASYCSSVNPYT